MAQRLATVSWMWAAALALAACSNPLQTGVPPSQNPLTSPPWETFVRAGPEAHKEIDYETLNGEIIASAQPGELVPDKAIAVDEIKETTEADQPNEDQQAAATEPAKAGEIKAVAVLPVQGAGKPGNAELTQAMRDILGDAGIKVVNKPRRDALSIQGKVNRKQIANGNERVELIWQVITHDGKLLGDIKQANEVPAGSLDAGWGVNAEAASQAAAEGIAQLMQRYR
jgi:hypothetical protein